ncbi:MAG: protein kinase [Bacteroidetes bacterium]|nr:protein kinase [Bacteroidota bacterium]MBU1116473.1 protein kinase [Bacteroidota bacterium]MBU1797292.1 protein kinase [Bacteroidota bacterium]
MEETSNKILFDKFDIIKVLKKDQHAAVYLAHHIYLEKKIILKVLNTKTIGEKVIIDRFKREAKILAQLNSDNIIKVLDFGMFKEFFYISFEYFPSQNLRQVINANKLTVEQKEKLVVQLLKGLRAAHQNGIIHRDIKPENILVNELLELKLGDFGLAEAINDSFVTSQYSLVGTPSYMSPEQISGKQLTIQSDLFAVGIVILELFTRVNPFLGKDINESINLITKFDESKISFDLNGIPEKTKNVISNLLKRNPLDRYKNADEALKVLGITIDEKVKFLQHEQKKSNFNRKVIFQLVFAVLIVLILSIYFATSYNNEKSVSENFGNEVTEFGKDDSAHIAAINKDKSKIDLVDKEETSSQMNSLEHRLSSKMVDLSLAFKKQNGELFVECLPWAEIYINNEKLETTPIKSNITLLEGKYELKLRHPEYPEFVDSIKILPKQLTSYKVNLDTLFGFLDCKVFPWGNVYIDNVYKGETPLLKPIILEPKAYSLEIRNPQFKTVKKIVTITRRDTLKLVQNFNSALN